MRLQDRYDVGIYCRLSRDDNNGSAESMSIANQRQMLLSYIQERGWNLQDIYVDDGYSGTTFERPNWKRLVLDIEAGKINLVITKDLSRLGRNYVMTGQYTDFFFPQHGVRYIAVNDGYDTMNTDNDIAPFKNVLNEMYAGDISKKVRSARRSSALQGKFMGSLPPFGYMKSPTNKHQLIPDEESAPIMRRIFKLFSQGDSARHIAGILNSENIPSPAVYYYSKQGKKHPNPKVSNTWGSATIMQLLKNEVYIGNMVQGKRKVSSFKTGLREFTSPDDWIVVENTHEPLIDREVWNAVQMRLKIERRRNKVSHTGEVSLFSGIAKCADCGSAMNFNRKQQRGKEYMLYKCGRYANHGKSACSIHSISFEVLEETVLRDIQNNAILAAGNQKKLIRRLEKYGNREQEEKRLSLEKKLCGAHNRLSELDNLIRKLFEERYAGNVPDSIFKRLMSDYEKEQQNLQINVADFQSSLTLLESSACDVERWVDSISQYTQIETLTRSIVTELIDHINVYESYEINGEKHQDIEVNYKFVGSIDTRKNV